PRAGAWPPAAGCTGCRTRRPGPPRTAATTARPAGCAAWSTLTSYTGPGSLAVLNWPGPPAAACSFFLLERSGAVLHRVLGQVDEGGFQRLLQRGQSGHREPA